MGTCWAMLTILHRLNCFSLCPCLSSISFCILVESGCPIGFRYNLGFKINFLMVLPFPILVYHSWERTHLPNKKNLFKVAHIIDILHASHITIGTCNHSVNMGTEEFKVSCNHTTCYVGQLDKTWAGYMLTDQQTLLLGKFCCCDSIFVNAKKLFFFSLHMLAITEY